jgi:hypothetical protein
MPGTFFNTIMAEARFRVETRVHPYSTPFYGPDDDLSMPRFTRPDSCSKGRDGADWSDSSSMPGSADIRGHAGRPGATGLYIDSGEGLLKADADEKVTTIARGWDGRANGIVRVKGMEFIQTSWGGIANSIFLDGSSQVLLDTRESRIAADTNLYDPSKRVMYLTTDSHNTVIAYSLRESATDRDPRPDGGHRRDRGAAGPAGSTSDARGSLRSRRPSTESPGPIVGQYARSPAGFSTLHPSASAWVH